MARLDGANAVSLVVQKQSGTNAVKVADRRLGPARGGQAHTPP